jgi:phosphoglycolate phosphatase
MPLVLLDLDGTLLDSAPGITASVRAAYRTVGLPVPPDDVLRSFVGPPIWDSLRTHGVPADRVDEVVHAYRTSFADAGMYDATVFDGIVDLLRDLRAAGLTLVVATAKPEVFARPICDRLGLADLVDGVFGAPLDESATKADVIARALASLADRPDATATLMVGDREHDVHGAAEHGVACVGVTWGYAAPGELETAGAVAVVGTTDALRDEVLARLAPARRDEVAPRA